MKKIILISLILIIACKKKQTYSSIETFKDYSMNIKNKIYYLDYHIPSSTTIDIYINDIKIATSSLDGYCELNPFILETGNNTIKIRLYSLEKKLGSEGNRMINLYDIIQKPNELTPLRVRLYTTNENEEDIVMLHEFENPKFEGEIPVYEAQWKFEAEFPYKLEGWSNAQDLSKWDQQKLEDKVVAKYKEYRELLNSGNHQEFMQLQEFSNTETFKSLFLSQESIKDELNTDFFELQKNIMMPLENYQMKLYSEGRLVTLERSDLKPVTATDADGEDYSTYLFGQSALFAYREKPLEDDGISFYYDYILLMIPEGSDELQIVRVIQGID